MGKISWGCVEARRRNSVRDDEGKSRSASLSVNRDRKDKECDEVDDCLAGDGEVSGKGRDGC